MRLNGRREILAHIGRRYNPQDRATWRRIRQRYLEALRYLNGSFHVWTTSEELDALDRQRSLTLDAVLAAKAQAERERARGECEGERRAHLGWTAGAEFQRLVRDLYPGLVRKKRT